MHVPLCFIYMSFKCPLLMHQSLKFDFTLFEINRKVPTSFGRSCIMCLNLTGAKCSVSQLLLNGRNWGLASTQRQRAESGPDSVLITKMLVGKEITFIQHPPSLRHYDLFHLPDI